MLQIEPGTNGNHEPIGQSQNDGSSANSQESAVSMDNVCPEGTETNMLHLQVEELWEGISMWGVPNASKIIRCGITKDFGLLESGRMTMLQV